MLLRIVMDFVLLGKWLSEGFLDTVYGTKKKDEPALIHLYAGESWHNEGYVLGNRLGLKKLRAAIDAALAREVPVASAVFTGDGEGYNLVVVPHDEAWDKVALPYTAEDALTSVLDTDIRPEDLVARFRKVGREYTPY